jgi:demethylmenaquinone methyltransferase/2-methoxy-6-polyprenyl-1,4-benzoquinol methylase
MRSLPSPAARRLATLDRDGHLGRPDRHGAYVATLFDAVEPSYDRFTRWFSFGMDARWKRQVRDLVRRLAPEATATLDCGTGTGDMALADGTVALDLSLAMLRAARRRALAAGCSLRLARGDMQSLPFAPGSVDVVTAAYAIRSVQDPHAALSEAHRVLRPGGLLVTLDFYRPVVAWWRKVFLGYLRAAGGAAGWFLHRVPATYGYIAPSIERWCTAAEFTSMLARHRFRELARREYLGGGIGIHAARRGRGLSA